jgi:hypothetical protein
MFGCLGLSFKRRAISKYFTLLSIQYYYTSMGFTVRLWVQLHAGTWIPILYNLSGYRDPLIPEIKADQKRALDDHEKGFPTKAGYWEQL